MKKFKKEDLKFGDIVTLRNEEKGIFVDVGIRFIDNSNLYIESINEDLTNKGAMGKGLDIMKVERYSGLGCPGTNIYALKTLYERKEEIIDEKEKEYLSNVIRPFRNKVKYIQKAKVEEEFIIICIRGIETNSEDISLPYFKKETMYKNMELDKKYSLEELGL